ADQRGARVSEISTARAGESAGGMATNLRHAQSAETLPLRMEPPKGLKALDQPIHLLFSAAGPAPKTQNPDRGDRVSVRSRIVRPYLRRAPRVKTSDGCLFRWSQPPPSWRKLLGGVGRNYRKPSGRIGRRRAASRIDSCLETTATNVQNPHESRGPPTKLCRHSPGGGYRSHHCVLPEISL